MASVRRALLLSTSDRYVALAANFLTTAIVSRLLTPDEIGVSVIALAVIGIVLILRDFATTNFLIQRPSLSVPEIRGAFTLQLTLTLVLVAGLMAAAPRLAEAYQEPQTVVYFAIVSLAIVIELVPLQVVALMRRELRFGTAAVLNMTTVLVTSATTLVLASLGFSFMSFAWAWLAASVTTALVALVIQRPLWIFLPTFRHWRAMVTFGGYNGLIGLGFKLDMIPLLILGRLYSHEASALLSRGNMICQIPEKIALDGVMNVLLPTFSASVRDGHDLKQPYLQAIAFISAVQWPALLLLALLSYPVIEIILGPQWHDVVPVVRILAVATLFSFVYWLNYLVSMAIGAIRAMAILAGLLFPVLTLLLAASAYLGGLFGVACCMTVVVPVQAAVTIVPVINRVGIGWSELAAAVWRSGLTAMATVSLPLAVFHAEHPHFAFSIMQGVVAGVLGFIGWLAALWLTNHPLFAELTRFGLPRLRPAVTRQQVV